MRNGMAMYNPKTKRRIFLSRNNRPFRRRRSPQGPQSIPIGRALLAPKRCAESTRRLELQTRGARTGAGAGGWLASERAVEPAAGPARSRHVLRESDGAGARAAPRARRTAAGFQR